MPTPHQRAPTLTNKSTFATVKDWVDFHQPGDGNKFIAWVQMEGDKLHYGPLHLDSAAYGPPPANKAVGWLGGWLLITKVGPDLGGLIGTGIQGGTQAIPKELTGTAEGIGTVSPATLWQQFLQAFTARALWVRIAEGILGGGLIVVAFAKLGGNSKVGQTATKVGKAVKLL